MVIMGGGRTAENLALSLLDSHYEVVIVEKDHRRCRALADRLDVTVHRGDGTNLGVLETAGTRKADCFVATGDRDQDNLVAAQLARDYFLVKKVVVRVNDPGNLATFRLLGFHDVVCSADILAGMIEREANPQHTRLIATLNRGEADIISYTLAADSALDGCSLAQLSLPPDCLIISVIRDGKLLIPHGSTVLQSGDELDALAGSKSRRELNRMMNARK